MRTNAGLILVLLAMAAAVIVLVSNGDGTIGGLSADDFAQGSYLAVICVVLGASVLASARMNASAALKAAGLWGLGFVVLIGLYAYRGELREIGDRMLAEILPGHAIEIAGADGRTVMVARADDRHFSVMANVDGRSVRFLVDTGATMVAIDRKTASDLGYDPDQLSYRDLVWTANGTARSAPITIDSLKIGDIERRNVRAAVLDAGGDGNNLLGMSFLGTLSRFEFQGSRLVLKD